MIFRLFSPTERLGRRGVSVWIAVLAIGVAALTASLAVPGLRYYEQRAAAEACDIAMAEAQRRIDNALPLSGDTLRPAEARFAAAGGGVADWEERWERLCPTGGDVALLKDRNEPSGYRVVCALHMSDPEMRARLNASNAETRLREALEQASRRGEAPGETVTVTLNGKPFSITRAEAEPDISHGTRTTPGYRGVVAFYGAGEDGELSWFCYADEAHCALWRAGEGWSIDGGVKAP